MYEIKTEDVNEDEIGSVVIEEFFGLMPKMYSFLVDKSKHKKAKDMNKNVVATISNNGNKDVLLNNKCIRHSVNRIQSKDGRIGTHEINKTLLSSFNDKIYIQNNGFDGLALGHQS